MQAAGVTFLYISHYLEEIYEVCRSVTVLRDGQVVAEAPLEEMPKDRVVAAMVGDAVARGLANARRANAGIATTSRPAPALELRDLHLGGVVSGVSLQVAAGECVGLAGLAGSGKGEIGDAIAGLLTPSAGTIRVAGDRSARRRCGRCAAQRASATCRATATPAASSRCSPSPRT